jgi:UDP-glucose 4-epimerase
MQTRCFCHVSDVVAGLVALSENPEAFGKVFNLGGDEEISIRDLAERVVELVDSESQLEYVPYDAAYEEGFEDMERRVPNTNRAKQLVGFKSSVNLDEIIRSVIEDLRA